MIRFASHSAEWMEGPRSARLKPRPFRASAIPRVSVPAARLKAAGGSARATQAKFRGQGWPWRAEGTEEVWHRSAVGTLLLGRFPHCHSGDGKRCDSVDESRTSELPALLPIRGSPWRALCHCDVPTTAYFHFFRDTLYRISAAFTNYGGTNFRATYEAFSAKYGPPLKELITEYQNDFGAKFGGRLVIWDNGVSAIELSETTEPRISPQLSLRTNKGQLMRLPLHLES
jgi:hypothetical protein